MVVAQAGEAVAAGRGAVIYVKKTERALFFTEKTYLCNLEKNVRFRYLTGC